jgi:hypothetical protein
VVAPGTGKRTVAFALEDGPQTPDSQLYVYVGKKQKSGTVLQRNGLVGGDLWVFASDNPANNSEATFNKGTLDGHWVKLADAANEADQEAKADAAGAFGFVRIEDGAFGQSKKRFDFVTTGESTAAVGHLQRRPDRRGGPGRPGQPRQHGRAPLARGDPGGRNGGIAAGDGCARP